ncbi:MAG: ORF6N domain-containing protein [Paludibacteraceae bacterium]|nr:ORF6N domain-containing protein [Paludibacteraceae bacterium]
MENKELAVIQNKILVIRNQQVMIDRDIAELYGVETKRLNEQVKRNIERFPERFMFQLTLEEYRFLRSQFATSKNETRGGRQYLPYAFTEQGCAMLSSVLKSDTAIQTSIKIMDDFVAMRRFILSNRRSFSD